MDPEAIKGELKAPECVTFSAKSVMVMRYSESFPEEKNSNGQTSDLICLRQHQPFLEA